MDPLTLPPEWAPQSFVLLAWPHPEGDFAPWLEAVEHSYALTLAAISQRQGAVIVCRDADHRAHIDTLLQGYPIEPARIRFAKAPYRDTWVRDTAPLTVQRGHPAACQLIDFRFNGWGGKYPSQVDDALGEHLYGQGIFGSTPYRRVDWVLEGGSIETDGAGTLLATRSSIQNPNRNPDPRRTEAVLAEHLGIKRFLWLDHGRIEGDDTDAHIDTLARFCNPEIIVYQACEDPGDAHYAPLQAMAEQLAGFETAAGRPYRLIPLPLPRAIHDTSGRRLPASYANFLIVNDALLAPVYDDPADAEALARLRQAFPDREIVAIPARALIHQYGSLHCMTMQYPQSVRFEENRCWKICTSP
ncbi:agmatine deiminase family protein [Methylohalobius crimeensis]|uniref:agmatine deiminase family protein n=1 Tax=Methylohalobius crimeensis TaxID=244365 RepID=UPI0003B6F630|nr:agmatine deiminase family protein [Methylohalobius crimeensis]